MLLNNYSMDTINNRIQYVIDQHFNGNVLGFCRDSNIKQSTMGSILGSQKSRVIRWAKHLASDK
jgi:hypothetical protein